MTRTCAGWACAVFVLVGCAGPSAQTILGDDSLRGYRGVVLQEEIIPALDEPEAGGVAWINPIWVPWRATFGVIGFVLSGDLLWFSGDTSPWIIKSGQYPLWEDVYAPGEIPTRSRPFVGRRNPGTESP